MEHSKDINRRPHVSAEYKRGAAVPPSGHSLESGAHSKLQRKVGNGPQTRLSKLGLAKRGPHCHPPGWALALHLGLNPSLYRPSRQTHDSHQDAHKETLCTLLFVALVCTSQMYSRRSEMLTLPILPQATPKGFPPKQLGCTRFTTPFPTRVGLRRRSRALTCFEIATRAYISKPISCLRSDVRDLAVCVGSKPEAGIEKRFTLPTKSHENKHLDNTMQCARVRNLYSDGTSARKGTTATLYDACERLPAEALYALVRG